MVEKLIQKLNSLSPMSELLAVGIRGMAEIQFYSTGEIISKAGQVCDKARFIAKGLTRSFYQHDDLDITSRFMEEGTIVTSWMSFYTQQPGLEFIEAVVDTSLVCLKYSDIQKLYSDFPEFNSIGRRQVEFAFYLAEQRTQMLRKHTAEEKYKFFIANHPTLLQQVALKHIATYLGMSEETLSRVRSRYHRNNS